MTDKQFSFKMMVTAMAIALGALCAQALPTSRYATTSRLNSGTWVKINIPESGIYQITYAELQEMGFSNPANVRLYGFGGHPISEVLNGNVPDDLIPVPVERFADKMVFYGCGPVQFDLKYSTSTTHFERAINTYSTTASYFLTESSAGEAAPVNVPSAVIGSTKRTTSYDLFYHEIEMENVGLTGKTFLGENIFSGRTWTDDGQLWFDYSLPQIVGSKPICVYLSAAALLSGGYGYVSCNVESGGQRQEVGFSVSGSRIYSKSDDNTFYNLASPYTTLTLTDPQPSGRLNPWISTPNIDKADRAMLDHFIITYQRNNVLDESDNGQMRMGMTLLSSNDVVIMPSASSSLRVWNIDTPTEPVSMQLSDYDDGEGTVGRAFSPIKTMNSAQFIAFDPSMLLKTISSYEPVTNQNLHGQPVPDMLIVTSTPYLAQAERVANLHRELDGMDVLVVDQKQVFNEFSSGTPDAMAIRMLCKMFYDRDNTKFRYLLMFGPGSYDNRGLKGKRDNVVITYESKQSVREDQSYACDDFFGLLEDNSGSEPSADLLCLGVGRMTGSNLEEATSDVDKLENYLRSNDYGPWRNNIMIACDTGDNDLHLFQAEESYLLLQNELNTGMAFDKVYNDQFARAANESDVADVTRRTASEAKQHWSDVMKAGQYFSTYIGHAGPTAYTKYAHMWTSNDVLNTSYSRLPIMSTACCDVARYDGGVQGIAEVMFHKKDGGAIALLTSGRAVYATDNDALNRAFMRAMFTYEATGQMPRLGDAYKAAKRSFGTTANLNKMAFMLLGDPAIQINYPKPLFKITKVGTANADNVSSYVTCYPLQSYNIEAQVLKPGTNEVDDTFNGNATITLYDNQRLYKSNVSSRVDNQRDTISVYYPRNKLAVVEGRVTNGIFKGTIVPPRYAEALRSSSTANMMLMLSAYAHRDNSTEMVNGSFSKLRLGAYNESYATPDDEAPVVESLAFVGHEGSDLPQVGSSAPLHIVVTDNVGLNIQSHSVGGKMKLTLDGGASVIADVAAMATVSDGSKRAVIDYPLDQLEPGDHVLSFIAYDMTGNSTTATLPFQVVNDYNATVTPADDAVTAPVQLTFASELDAEPSLVFKVIDIAGNLVWSTATTTSEVTWPLTDHAGNAVAPGLYKCFATFRTAGAHGGSPMRDIVVLPSVR